MNYLFTHFINAAYFGPCKPKLHTSIMIDNILLIADIPIIFILSFALVCVLGTASSSSLLAFAFSADFALLPIVVLYCFHARTL